MYGMCEKYFYLFCHQKNVWSPTGNPYLVIGKKIPVLVIPPENPNHNYYRVSPTETDLKNDFHLILLNWNCKAQSFKFLEINIVLKLLSHVFYHYFNMDNYALFSPYMVTAKNSKIVIYLNLAWPNTSFTVLSKWADNMESLFMNVRGVTVTDKLPI